MIPRFHTGEPFEPGACYSYVQDGKTERRYFQLTQVRFNGATSLYVTEDCMATGESRLHTFVLFPGDRLQEFARFETCAMCPHYVVCVLRGEPKVLAHDSSQGVST